MSPRLPSDRPVLALGYLRVSTDQQAQSGAGLAAQRAAIEAEAARRGWTLEIVEEDGGASSATLDRPALTAALDRLDRGDADVLVVAKLDRLSRSVAQGAEIIDRARSKGWGLVMLDFGLDTSTPAGEMVAAVVLSASQYERRMIGARTKDALAAKKAAGVILGRPPMLDPAVVARILGMRDAGMTLTSIAMTLTDEGIPTAKGGAKWWPSTVKAVLGSEHAQRLTKGA